MDRHEHEHFWAAGPPWGHGYSVGPGPGPGMFFLALNTIFWLVLLGLFLWAAVKWILPSILPMITEKFALFSASTDSVPADVSAFEILRRRYAAGEVDGVTFEQMWERLEASYRQEAQHAPLERQLDGTEYSTPMYMATEEHSSGTT